MMRLTAAALLALLAACAGTFEVTVDDEWMQRFGPPGIDEPDEPQAPPSDADAYAFKVGGKDFVVRGVAYGPQEEETCGKVPFYEAVALDDLSEMGDAKAIAFAGFNTVRVYSPLSKAIKTDECNGEGACWIGERQLDALDAHGLRIIITISSIWDFRKQLHVGAAQRYLMHPTVIALQVGNEMNHNALYEWSGRTPSELVAMANNWTQEIRDAGWDKPIILGWGHPSADHREVLRGTIADAVAYQLYERRTLNTSNGQSVFDWHRTTFDGKAAAKLPGLVTEYGADSLNDGRLDEQAQADAVGKLLMKVEKDAERDDGIAGGIIFQWADNWAKAEGDPCVHDRTGKPGGTGGPYPDGIYHEEWFGIVRRDRQPRKALGVVREILTGGSE